MKRRKHRPEGLNLLRRDVRPGDLAGYCGFCKKDAYFRPRPPENYWCCLRCLSRMKEVKK